MFNRSDYGALHLPLAEHDARLRVGDDRRGEDERRREHALRLHLHVIVHQQVCHYALDLQHGEEPARAVRTMQSVSCVVLLQFRAGWRTMHGSRGRT